MRSAPVHQPHPRALERLRTHARRLVSRTLALALRRLGAPAAIALAVAAPRVAKAQQPKSVVVYIEGQNADAVRDEVVGILPGGIRVIETDRFSDALRKAGHKAPMGNTVAAAKLRERLLTRIRKAIVEVNAAGAVIGRIRNKRTGTREVYLLYVGSIPGDLVVDEAVPLGDSGEGRKSALKRALEQPMTELAPAPEQQKAKKDAEPPDETPLPRGEQDDKNASKPTPREVSTALFIVDLSFQTGGRYFEYSDPLTANLRPYDVFGASMARGSAEIYPAGLGDVPVAKDIGLTISYAMAFGLSSATQGGEPITTSWSRFGAGVRGRIRFGESPSGMLGVSASFHLLRFAFEVGSELALAKEVPDVSYKLLRFGLDARIPAGPVALELDGAFLLPPSGGALYDRFRDSSVLGVEGRAGVAIPIGAGFEARLMGEYTRFFSAFAPQPGDAYVAGGALDQLIGIRVGAGYAY